MDVFFDMETSDPDDVLTLCWLATHPKVSLIGVSVTPGTQEQIGLVAQIFEILKISRPSIGSFDPQRKDGSVSNFHYRYFSKKLASPDGFGFAVLANALSKFPNLTLLTGAPLKNLHQYLLREAIPIQHWVCQGGFAGINIVDPKDVLPKFAGLETCPTFNLNGDPKGALLALSSTLIQKRTLVSKNVCHGVRYDESLHQKMKQVRESNSGLDLIHRLMDIYLERYTDGKMLHDPLAACTMLEPEICSFESVELYRQKGEWGSRKLPNSSTRISIAVNHDLFYDTFCHVG